MRDLLTVAASENFTPGDAKAWSKMANAISKRALPIKTTADCNYSADSV
jgi:hypothetical protein